MTYNADNLDLLGIVQTPIPSEIALLSDLLIQLELNIGKKIK